MLEVLGIFFAIIIGSYVLGIAWAIIFWVASFINYHIVWFLSLFKIFIDIRGEKNVWSLFWVVIGISW